MDPDDDFGFYEADDRPVCFRCDGEGTVDCHCGGDLCVCGANDDLTCPACGGDGHVSQERHDRQIAEHRKLMAAIWGPDWDKAAEKGGKP